MHIAFLASSCVPFHGKTLDERPLGGTETAVIRLAEALNNLGHETVVVTPVSNPPVSEVLYLPFRALKNFPAVDVVIAVRDWNLIFAEVRTKKRFFWTGDSYDQYATFGIGDRRVQEKMDALFTVSEWHADTLAEAAGFPREKVWPLRNGVHLPHFEGAELKRAKRLFYSSSPYRGLRYLPEIFARVKVRHPDAELHLYSGFKVYEGAPPPPQALLEELEQVTAVFGRLPDCHFVGNIPQANLAREMMASSILVYPNTFEETSCITAMEAKAAGCVVVTSNKAALPETVGEGGILIPGEPGTPEYRDSFVEAVCGYFDKEEEMKRIGESNRQEAFTRLGWEHRAKELIQYLSTRHGIS